MYPKLPFLLVAFLQQIWDIFLISSRIKRDHFKIWLMFNMRIIDVLDSIVISDRLGLFTFLNIPRLITFICHARTASLDSILYPQDNFNSENDDVDCQEESSEDTYTVCL